MTTARKERLRELDRKKKIIEKEINIERLELSRDQKREEIEILENNIEEQRTELEELQAQYKEDE